jgi:hypothetical protein
MEMWVNLATPQEFSPFMGHDEGGGELNKWIFWHAGGYGLGLNFHVNGILGRSFAADAPWQPAAQVWYHVALTKSGDVYTFYVNGVPIGTATDPTLISDPATPMTIGRAEGFFFSGLVDEVAMYNRALKAAEVKAIYDAAGGGKCAITSNVAPAVSVGGPYAALEGASITFDKASATDADGDPLTYTWDFGDGTTATGLQVAHTYTDDHPANMPVGTPFTIRLSVSDGKTVSVAETQASITNVAPTATIESNALALSEGQSFTVSLRGANDPSVQDVLEFRFDCGTGEFSEWSSTASRACTAADNGALQVRAELRDDEGDGSAYLVDVQASNIAPTATLTVPGRVLEGQAPLIAFSRVVEPSAADRAAGLLYQIDCGSGYGAPSTADNGTCPASADQSATAITVKGKVCDKDGGCSAELSGQYTVDNAKPVVTLSVVSPVPPGTVTNAITISSGELLSAVSRFVDPAAGDAPWATSMNWGDRVTETGSATAQDTDIALSHRYLKVGGPYALAFKVTDKDGAWGVNPTLSVTVVTRAIDVDVKPGVSPNLVSLSSTTESQLEVALLGSATFNLGEVIAGSLTLGNDDGRDTRQLAGQTIVDRNADGVPDLVVKFSRDALKKNGDLTSSSRVLVLRGTFGAAGAGSFRGQDAVTVTQ